MSQENVEVASRRGFAPRPSWDRTKGLELFRDECPREEEQTLTYTEGKGEFTPIGSASERRTPAGGGFALSIPLEDDSGSTAGELHGVCIATQGNGEGPIIGTGSATADLLNGQLALNVGGEINEPITTGSIVGGTGDYEGATGTFESSGGNRPTDTFEFTLP